MDTAVSFRESPGIGVRIMHCHRLSTYRVWANVPIIITTVWYLLSFLGYERSKLQTYKSPGKVEIASPAKNQGLWVFRFSQLTEELLPDRREYFICGFGSTRSLPSMAIYPKYRIGKRSNQSNKNQVSGSLWEMAWSLIGNDDFIDKHMSETFVEIFYITDPNH